MGNEQPQVGRPRSEEARTAVLHAVDDLLVEVGYNALTMKGIAARAGVGRQTVYRWWSTKADVLFEAALTDAGHQLRVEPQGSTADDLTAYLEGVVRFVTTSDAGAAYRALLGEAQHDPGVLELLRSADLFRSTLAPLVAAAVARGDVPADLDPATITAILVGPVVFRLLCGEPPIDNGLVVSAALAALAT